MDTPASVPIRYLILLFGDGKPMFFGPYNDEDPLNAMARQQRVLYPAAKLAKLTIKGPKDMETEEFTC